MLFLASVIISHRHQFIFLKTIKTAGTSVELFLRQFCGPDDVVTPVVPEDEGLAIEMGVGGPRNYTRLKKPRECGPSDLRRAIRKRAWPHVEVYSQHQRASEIRTLVGDEVWNGYQRITIVRDPWEQFVSRFFWVTRPENRRSETIEEYLDQLMRKPANWNWAIYSIDDEIAATQILRYETLEGDLRELCESLGLNPRLDLPRAKANVRPSSARPGQVLTQSQIDRIAIVARREIEEFGYSAPLPG